MIGKDLFVGEVEVFCCCCFAYFLWIIARFFNGSSLDYFRVLRSADCFSDLSIGLFVSLCFLEYNAFNKVDKLGNLLVSMMYLS